jgi:hypothetical protein
MTKSRGQRLSEKADEERRRCRDWLLHFMHGNQPKFLTKDELRGARCALNVSKNSFDFGWIDAIETTGRHDWYEPLRRRPRTQELTCLCVLAVPSNVTYWGQSGKHILDLRLTAFDPNRSFQRVVVLAALTIIARLFLPNPPFEGLRGNVCNRRPAYLAGIGH